MYIKGPSEGMWQIIVFIVILLLALAFCKSGIGYEQPAQLILLPLA